MDNFVYSAISGYFQTLEKTGYFKYSNVQKLLILIFYYNLIYHDYRGYVKKEDYSAIEKALNCLYGTNCLIPYPDYLKMGKLKLGEMTEVLSRTKAVEDYSKELDQRILDNDVLIADNTMRIDESGARSDDYAAHFVIVDSRLHDHDVTLASHGDRLDIHDSRLDDHDEHFNTVDERLDTAEERLDNHDETLLNHEDRIVAVESTKVVKGKNHIQNIPDIDLSSFAGN